MSQGFVSRYAIETTTNTPGVRKYRLNTVDSPVAYFDGTLYHTVNPVSLLDTSTAKAGGIFLRDKNLSSIGVKKADDPYKFIGFRPDNRQNGDVQLEFSIESIEIDGKEVSVDLSKNEQAMDSVTNLGSLAVSVEKNGCRVLVPCSRNAEGFKIVFRMHTKGLNVMYRPRTDVWAMQEFSTGELKYRLRPPLLVDMETMLPLKNSGLIKHSMTDLGGGEYRYVKESTDLFASPEIRAALPEAFYIDASVAYSTYSAVVKTNASTWQVAHDKLVADSFSDWEQPTPLGCWEDSGDSYISRVGLQYDVYGIPAGNVIDVTENITIYSTNASVTYISQELFSFDVCYYIDAFQKHLGEMFGSSMAPLLGGSNPLRYNQAGRDYVSSRLESELFLQTMLREAYDYKNTDPSTDIASSAGSHYFTFWCPYYSYPPYLEITVGPRDPGDMVLLRDWEEIEDDVPDRCALNALRAIRNKWTIDGNDTYSVKAEDDTTEAWSAELTVSDGSITGSEPTT